eukprot:6987757-Lingulodinium_polyedra.AAC.1
MACNAIILGTTITSNAGPSLAATTSAFCETRANGGSSATRSAQEYTQIHGWPYTLAPRPIQHPRPAKLELRGPGVR